MPRANRHYIPGYVWHVIYRCYKLAWPLDRGDCWL